MKRGRRRKLTTNRSTLRKRAERLKKLPPGTEIDISEFTLDWLCWEHRLFVRKQLDELESGVKQITLAEIDKQIAELTKLREHVVKFKRDKIG